MDLVQPDFIFLNEVLTFQFEAKAATDLFHGEYDYLLNSDDTFDKELPFMKNRSHGGTMILWRRSLSEFISALPTPSASFAALLFHPPGAPASLHVSLYLPTSGKESEFITEITNLRVFLEDHLIKDPDLEIYIRGDSNVNPNHAARSKILENFKTDLNLVSTPIKHKTYHHFLGNGLFDSNIDVILHSKSSSQPEQILKIFCKTDYPSIISHHDAIVSSFSLPLTQIKESTNTFQAPEISNPRIKIIWNEESLPNYQELVGDNLLCLRERWHDPSSKTCVSILLQATSGILSSAASSTNRSVSLANASLPRSKRAPRSINISRHKLRRKLLKWRKTGSIIDAVQLNAAKTYHRKLVRAYNSKNNSLENSKMFAIMSPSTSHSIYQKIRAIKKPTAQKIPFLKVGKETFYGNDVKNGFFLSISSLKKRDSKIIEDTLINHVDDYNNILELCQNKRDLPNISIEASNKILFKMKKTVNDLYSITPAHFTNAGKSGLVHFNFLLNIVIDDVNNATVEELNSCYALLLYKSHGKIRTNDNAYRTISTCPVVSKALDIYIRDLHSIKWNSKQATTQYQGDGRCHDLAALLVTEVMQHSINTLKEPAYLLFLDARSAFDRVIPELLIRNLYLSGMDGNSINYINNRLTNRVTFIDWDRNIMGPIEDELGLEQGGKNSGEFYKIYSNDHLENAQRSLQGIDIGNNQIISAIGLADDSCLVANKLSKLFNILFLTTKYCEMYGVTLCPSKTKLLRIAPKLDIDSLETFNPITINGQEIPFSSEAEHVGTIRSVNGNIPHIMNRITAHRKALSATLSSGLAYKSRVNPIVGLRLEKIYGAPVLLSGVSSLVVCESELGLIDQHFKDTYQNLQKLHQRTPRSVVFFLGGSLPAQALVHLKMLSLFGMVARLPRDPLNIHARNILVTAKASSKSWFCKLRDVCLLYNLPHPLSILDFPPSKEQFKKTTTSHVITYWEEKLRGEAALLPSLLYFKPEFMNLKTPHLIWKTAGSNPYEVSKAIQQARLLSGRYRLAVLEKNWTNNREGICQNCFESPETLEHMLISCSAYLETKKKLYSLWLATSLQVVYELILTALSSEKQYLLQFLLDCSVLPNVIRAAQDHGYEVYNELFYLTRTWCFAIHRQRMKGLGRWNFQ